MDCAEPFLSAWTTAHLRRKERSCPHYSRHVQFLQTAVCGAALRRVLCEHGLDGLGYSLPVNDKVLKSFKLF